MIVPVSPSTIGSIQNPSDMDVEGEAGTGEAAERREPVENALVPKRSVLRHSSTASRERYQRLLDAKLDNLAKPKKVDVPYHPAPPAPFIRNLPPLSAELEMLVRGDVHITETALDRTLDSTIGRSATFCITSLLFSIGAICIVFWHDLNLRFQGLHFIMFILGWGAMLLMYAVVPFLAMKGGMDPRDTGWKPYLTFYRCAYIVALPALWFLWFGGRIFSFGIREGAPGGIAMGQLKKGTFNFFEASDGFVALNLTKGVVETLYAAEHGRLEQLSDSGQQPRWGRFRDAQLKINREPFSDIPEPTLPPDTRHVYRVAPIFDAWAPCLARYRVSGACLDVHEVRGWAVSSTESWCASLGTIACRPPQPSLEPVYKCSTNPVYATQYGNGTNGPGLCGRVIPHIPVGVIAELKVLLKLDGWPDDSLPNETSTWVNVQADPCISSPEPCQAGWSIMIAVGAALSASVFFCIGYAAYQDCATDKVMRDALRTWDSAKMKQGVVSK